MSGFVFAEGAGGLEFVGDFDGFYRAEADPWSQSGQSGAMRAYYLDSRGRLVQAIRRLGVGSAFEVGCGHGFVTALLDRELSGQVVGMDISTEAISRAREIHPDSQFIVGDITSIDRKVVPIRQFDCVLWGQILWYVLHAIDAAVENSLSHLVPGGFFIISQAFLRDQQYGREIADGYDGTVSLFRQRFRTRMQVMETRLVSDPALPHDDGLLVFRKL